MTRRRKRPRAGSCIRGLHTTGCPISSPRWSGAERGSWPWRPGNAPWKTASASSWTGPDGPQTGPEGRGASLRRVATIAGLTVREASRRRLLLALVGLTLIAIAFTAWGFLQLRRFDVRGGAQIGTTESSWSRRSC